MMTRKEFGGKLLSVVAAGTLANYSLVAEAVSLSGLDRGLNAKCNENGKSDMCHGSGNKADGCAAKDTEPIECRAPAPDAAQPPPEPPTPPQPPEPPICQAPAPDAEPPCGTDTCSQADAPTGNE